MATKHRLGDQSRDCSWLCSPSRIAFLDRTSPIPLNPLRSQRVTEHQTLPYVYFIFPLCLSRGRVEETQCLFGNLSLRGRTVGEAKKIDKSPPLVLEPPWWQVRWRLVPAVFFVLVGIYFFAYYILFLAHSITPPGKSHMVLHPSECTNSSPAGNFYWRRGAGSLVVSAVSFDDGGSRSLA